MRMKSVSPPTRVWVTRLLGACLVRSVRVLPGEQQEKQCVLLTEPAVWYTRLTTEVSTPASASRLLC